MIGSSNRFAHAAALAVAEAPAQAYNPLFIYGGHRAREDAPPPGGRALREPALGHISACYVTSETFLTDFINSLRDKRIEGFKHRYRTYDLLLVDDIQFFEHRERIQEEFFHTFNSLYESGSQIVISSDRPPREIATLEEPPLPLRVGVITDIQPPDLETRIAILRKKVQTDEHRPPRPRGADVHRRPDLAEHPRARGRSRASSPSPRSPGAMTVDLAQDVLKDVFPQGEAAEVSIHRIQEITSERFGLSLEELCGEKRSQRDRLPAPGGDVPVARAHGLLAAADRQGVRRARPHDGDPRDVEDRAPDP